jgi:hypothetical protein
LFYVLPRTWVEAVVVVVVMVVMVVMVVAAISRPDDYPSIAILRPAISVTRIETMVVMVMVMVELSQLDGCPC